jgi:hypothetical protein
VNSKGSINPFLSTNSTTFCIASKSVLIPQMSKTKESRPPEGFHQEYIASLRYRNDLPPPEMPPKFLDIPHEGLARFLTPGFASNMARREEPNIDVDAEGGMPIDLVGIPGLHLGDESGMFRMTTDPACVLFVVINVTLLFVFSDHGPRKSSTNRPGRPSAPHPSRATKKPGPQRCQC